ncbi:MAG: hypothetical protein ACQESC_03875 [Nanobdellota archaeon]
MVISELEQEFESLEQLLRDERVKLQTLQTAEEKFEENYIEKKLAEDLGEFYQQEKEENDPAFRDKEAIQELKSRLETLTDEKKIVYGNYLEEKYILSVKDSAFNCFTSYCRDGSSFEEAQQFAQQLDIKKYLYEDNRDRFGNTWYGLEDSLVEEFTEKIFDGQAKQEREQLQEKLDATKNSLNNLRAKKQYAENQLRVYKFLNESIDQPVCFEDKEGVIFKNYDGQVDFQKVKSDMGEFVDEINQLQDDGNNLRESVTAIPEDNLGTALFDWSDTFAGKYVQNYKKIVVYHNGKFGSASFQYEDTVPSRRNPQNNFKDVEISRVKDDGIEITATTYSGDQSELYIPFDE